MNTNNNSTGGDDTKPKKSWTDMNGDDTKPPKAGDETRKTGDLPPDQQPKPGNGNQTNNY